MRVSYGLTSAGQGFADVATAIERWGRCLDEAEKPKGKAPPRRARKAS